MSTLQFMQNIPALSILPTLKKLLCLLESKSIGTLKSKHLDPMGGISLQALDGTKEIIQVNKIKDGKITNQTILEDRVAGDNRLTTKEGGANQLTTNQLTTRAGGDSSQATTRADGDSSQATTKADGDSSQATTKADGGSSQTTTKADGDSNRATTRTDGEIQTVTITLTIMVGGNLTRATVTMVGVITMGGDKIN